MRHLFSHGGERALGALLQQRPLLAFDFDGTLAPIVARPEEAAISQAVATRLAALAAQLPVAIVTGRAVDDVQGRLGFEPQYIVGNHGADDGLNQAQEEAFSQALQGLRARVAEHAPSLEQAGVALEDKGSSLAFHYRLSRQRERARERIDALLAPLPAGLRQFAGKMVVNVAPADAPDKAQAVHALVERSGAAAALFAGDDVNDEPVFAAAPAHWLTIRVGRDDASSRARYVLDGPHEMAMLLERIVTILREIQGVTGAARGVRGPGRGYAFNGRR
jgi:trehalose 6-phosphate phosphatase